MQRTLYYSKRDNFFLEINIYFLRKTKSVLEIFPYLLLSSLEICSRDFPRVSGTAKNMKITDTAQTTLNMTNVHETPMFSAEEKIQNL